MIVCLLTILSGRGWLEAIATEQNKNERRNAWK